MQTETQHYLATNTTYGIPAPGYNHDVGVVGAKLDERDRRDKRCGKSCGHMNPGVLWLRKTPSPTADGINRIPQLWYLLYVFFYPHHYHCEQRKMLRWVVSLIVCAIVGAGTTGLTAATIVHLMTS